MRADGRQFRPVARLDTRYERRGSPFCYVEPRQHASAFYGIDALADRMAGPGSICWTGYGELAP